MNTAQASLATIESFLSDVDARVKTAEANTEPGSIGGPTTHPVKNVDDNTQDATTGARAAENAKDVKKDQGPESVDSTPEAKPTKSGADQDVANYGIGTKVAPTGEDASSETQRAKPGKDDPGSSHPARTDNKELDGMKYAGVNPETDDLEKVAACFQEIGQRLMSDVIAMSQQQPQQFAATGKAAAVAQPDPALAHQVGYEFAGLLTGTMDKAAADKMVETALADTIKQAYASADRVADYLDAFAEQQRAAAQKQAAVAAPRRPQLKRAFGMPPGGAAGGAEGGVGGSAPPMPPSSAGAEGGAPPQEGGGGDDGSGGGGDGEAQLLEVLQELGIQPAELAQALLAEQSGGAGGAGGAPGEPPPAAAGGPPAGSGAMPPGAAAPGGMEVAASAKSPRRDSTVGKQAMSAMVTEIMRRDRMMKAAAAAVA